MTRTRTRARADQPVISTDGVVLYAPHPPRLVDEVHPGLWLGGSWERHRPSHPRYDLVVSVHHPDEQINTPATDRHVSLPMSDHGTVNDRQLETAVGLVVHALKDGATVNVRCWTGQNRSGLVVATTLVRLGIWEPAAAIAHLRAVRAPWVLCNPAFEAHVLARPHPAD